MKLFTTLDRYIINECWLPFSAGCGIVTGVWLGADQIRDAFELLARSNVDISVIFSIIFLSLPTILFTTIPIGAFLATFLVFNRLSSDSELIALRAGGVSLYRIATPAVLFGLILCIFAFILGNFIIPWSQPMAATIQAAAMQQTNLKSSHDFVYFERHGGKHVGQGNLHRVFYVKSISPDSNGLNDIILIDLSRPGNKTISFASEGEFNPSDSGWVLKNGITYHITSTDPSSSAQVAKFSEISIPVGESIKDINQRLNKLRDLNVFELWDTIQQHNKFNNKNNNIQTEQIYKLKVKFHEKFSYPFSCVVLALAGAPFGIMARRSRTNWGYAQTGVLIFLYFASQSSVGSLGDTGRIDAFWAAWIPNIILALVGTFVLYRRSSFSAS